MQAVCKKSVIAGRVQGVFYRATAARRARELGIKGYAINLADGRVEVLACGHPEHVRLFMDWLWIGPSASKVTSVEVSDAQMPEEQMPDDFRTG